MTRRTGFVWHEKYAWFDLGQDAGLVHPDGLSIQPDRHVYDHEVVRRFRSLVEVSGLLDQLTRVAPRKASEAELALVHPAAFIQSVKDLSDLPMGGEIGVFAPVPRGAYEIASLAAGGAIAAVDAVVKGEVDNAYALLRPAGHHAEPDRSMGFCIFSNAAIAARHALEQGGLDRVALVDWDVHHGNGTQAALYDEPRALTISIHQDRLFPPDDGFVDQVGEGPAAGTNLNVPLPPGCSAAAYNEVFDTIVLPALERFRPDLIIVPCGFDAGHMDPMGRMLMHSSGYRELTQKLLVAADQLCDGRLVFLHEGGYSRWTVPYYGLAVLEELSGIATEVVDPYQGYATTEGLGLLPHQGAAIEVAAKNLSRVPQHG
ncbi:class II histone deacetylase [Nocardioides kongjuensis]|uniref:Acetoin utilization deacetylase AcuC-like enzyme n=1 Tax=Nocardioides kongjuensis TaxID=349522 RepID=A0A852RN19_9ACTN|nr:class II histone deacetylase [Nocardioides kongjuensis]NYD31978.1 acetoin utilization deacetylase AcuC-like enzyme [Nocardioides kongjuensis]